MANPHPPWNEFTLQYLEAAFPLWRQPLSLWLTKIDAPLWLTESDANPAVASVCQGNEASKRTRYTSARNVASCLKQMQWHLAATPSARTIDRLYRLWLLENR